MGVLAQGTWVVVTDEEKALVLENTGDTRAPVLTLITRIDIAPLLAESDRSARLKDHKQHETVEPANYSRMGGERLAVEVCSYLALRAAEGKFDKVVLVASPQVLGALRAEMAPGLHTRVLAEIPKTMTGHPLPKIAQLVAQELDEV